MEKKHKCNYCDALLSETNSVFVHINRYDDRGRSVKSIWMCCKCWDNTRIQLPKNYNKCGNCYHLIFRDYKHNEGLCNLTRLHKCFTDRCVHDEDIM